MPVRVTVPSSPAAMPETCVPCSDAFWSNGRRAGAYVIPGDGPGKHRANVRRPWTMVRDAAGLAGDGEGTAARLHDLRHSFTTVARGLGYGDHVYLKLEVDFDPIRPSPEFARMVEQLNEERKRGKSMKD